jgi:hypothetical protein
VRVARSRDDWSEPMRATVCCAVLNSWTKVTKVKRRLIRASLLLCLCVAILSLLGQAMPNREQVVAYKKLEAAYAAADKSTTSSDVILFDGRLPLRDIQRLDALRLDNVVLTDTIRVLDELVAKERFRSFAFNVMTGFLLFLAWTVLDPRVKQGIQSDKVAEAERIKKEYQQKRTALEQEISSGIQAQLRPRLEELRRKEELLEKERQSLDPAQTQLAEARRKLESEQIRFGNEQRREATKQGESEQQLKARELQVAAQLREAERKLAQAQGLAGKLEELVTRFDGHLTAGGENGPAQVALNSDSELAAGIAEFRVK